VHRELPKNVWASLTIDVPDTTRPGSFGDAN